MPYQPGELVAVGYDNGKKVNSTKLTTAGNAAQINLTADKATLAADNEDLSYVTVQLTDSKGNLNPRAENLLKFKIAGPATIVGVGNANPRSLESCQLPQRKAWHGKCLVIIKSTAKAGNITLQVNSLGMQAKSLQIRAI